MKVNTYDKRHVRCEYGIYHDTEEPQFIGTRFFHLISGNFQPGAIRSKICKKWDKIFPNRRIPNSARRPRPTDPAKTMLK